MSENTDITRQATCLNITITEALHYIFYFILCILKFILTIFIKRVTSVLSLIRWKLIAIASNLLWLQLCPLSERLLRNIMPWLFLAIDSSLWVIQTTSNTRIQHMLLYIPRLSISCSQGKRHIENFIMLLHMRYTHGHTKCYKYQLLQPS